MCVPASVRVPVGWHTLNPPPALHHGRAGRAVRTLLQLSTGLGRRVRTYSRGSTSRQKRNGSGGAALMPCSVSKVILSSP
jgi:hypothetical protein